MEKEGVLLLDQIWLVVILFGISPQDFARLRLVSRTFKEQMDLLSENYDHIVWKHMCSHVFHVDPYEFKPIISEKDAKRIENHHTSGMYLKSFKKLLSMEEISWEGWTTQFPTLYPYPWRMEIKSICDGSVKKFEQNLKWYFFIPTDSPSLDIVDAVTYGTFTINPITIKNNVNNNNNNNDDDDDDECNDEVDDDDVDDDVDVVVVVNDDGMNGSNSSSSSSQGDNNLKEEEEENGSGGISLDNATIKVIVDNDNVVNNDHGDDIDECNPVKNNESDDNVKLLECFDSVQKVQIIEEKIISTVSENLVVPNIYVGYLIDRCIILASYNCSEYDNFSSNTGCFLVSEHTRTYNKDHPLMIAMRSSYGDKKEQKLEINYSGIVCHNPDTLVPISLKLVIEMGNSSEKGKVKISGVFTREDRICSVCGFIKDISYEEYFELISVNYKNVKPRTLLLFNDEKRDLAFFWAWIRGDYLCGVLHDKECFVMKRLSK